MMLYLRNGIRLQHAIRRDMSKAVGLNLQLFYLSNPTSDVRRSNRHAIAIDPINGRAAAPLDQELALVDAALPGANRRSSCSLFSRSRWHQAIALDGLGHGDGSRSILQPSF